MSELPKGGALSLPKGWVETTLGEVAIIIMGQSPKGDTCNVTGNGIPLLNGPTEFGEKSPLAVQYTIDARKKSKTDDLLFCVRGSTTGRMNWADKEYAIGRGIAAISHKNGSEYKQFTKAIFDYKLPVLLSIATGSTFPNVSRSQLENLELNLPPLPEQKAIAAVLSAFDDKIELLREQNQTLETLAQTIFKEWFVHFNFPFDFAQGKPDPNGKPYRDNGGEMVDSELGEIPRGWRVEQLGKELEVKRGGSPRPIKDYISDSGYRWLKISDATASTSPFIFKIKEHIKKEGLSKTTLLKAGSLVLSNSATPGIPKFLEVDSCIHDGWLHFPKTSIFSYQYLYLFFKHIRGPLLQQGNGSVFKNLKTDILKSWNMAIPDTEIIKFFNELTSPIFKKIKNTTTQIQTLSQTRDTLLPKLMSGAIRVKGFGESQ